MGAIKNLIQLPQGDRAVIKSIKGGHGLIKRLTALGIMEGKEILKVTSMIARGPIVLRCGNTEVAIGFGMAQKVLVELV